MVRGKLLVISANLEYNKTWCHEILVTAPEIWEGILVYINVYILQSILWSDAMTSWSWHQKLQEGNFYEFMSISWFLSLFSSLLLNWPVVEIYSVLCTSRCVVFYSVPPLMGQVLGKVLLTSWEINYWWCFRTSSLLKFQGF